MANIANVAPIRSRLAPSERQEQAPDDLVGAARRSAADVDHDRRRSAAGSRRRGWAPGSSAPGDRRRGDRDRLVGGRSPPPRRGPRCRRDRRPCRGAADSWTRPDGQAGGGRRRRSAQKTKTNARHRRSRRTEAADRRAEQEPAHLGRAVQAERLALPVGRRGVDEEAARRRVVDGRGQARSAPAGRGSADAPE